MTGLTLDQIHAQCVEEGDCQLWTGRLTNSGHPIHCAGGQKLLVRRLVYALQHGQLPAGTRQVVADTCQNTTCCNGHHLVVLSRSALVASSYRNRNMVAEYGKRQAALVNSGRAKLNLQVAREIRSDERTHAQVATALGVSASLVAKIRQQQIWREPAGAFSDMGLPR